MRRIDLPMRGLLLLPLLVVLAPDARGADDDGCGRALQNPEVLALVRRSTPRSRTATSTSRRQRRT
jgi:hypothetical protein